MVHFIAHIGTDEVKARLEECGRSNGYHVREWLTPGQHGDLRVAATMKIAGRIHGLGFRWDGADINELAARAIALDMMMTQLPQAVAEGRPAYWEDN